MHQDPEAKLMLELVSSHKQYNLQMNTGQCMLVIADTNVWAAHKCLIYQTMNLFGC